MSDHLSDRDPWVIPCNDVRQYFEFLMLHPPQLRKHALKLRLLSAIGLLRLSPDRATPKCDDLLLQHGPAVTEVSEEMLRQVLCDDVTLLKLHELIWAGEAGSYWSQKIENELDAETSLEREPEVGARIKAMVAARVQEAFSEDPVAVSHQRVELATAGTSRPRAIARQSLEDYIDAAIDMVSVGDEANTVMVLDGDDSNILIDGSVQLTENGDSLRQVFDDWIAYSAQAANVADIRSRLLVTSNTHYANTQPAGSGLDWFWATDTQDHLNAQPTDLWN